VDHPAESARFSINSYVLTSSDTICTVDENHGDSRKEVLGLDRHSLFLEVVE